MLKKIMILSPNSDALTVKISELQNCTQVLCPSPNDITAITENLRKERPCLVLIKGIKEEEIKNLTEVLNEAADDFGVKTRICLFAKNRILHPKISWVKNFAELEGLWNIL
jgi:pyridoxal/pyridoxine/pyridoxamine kinase